MATNEFTECGPALTARDLAAVEERYGVNFPAELRAHYLACNGGTPSRKCWPAAGDDPICLKRFLTVRPAEPVAGEADDGDALQDTLDDLYDGPHIPRELLPFADDWGGNYFCVDQISGAVYWFAMDLGDDFDRARRHLTDSLSAFVAGLIDEDD